MCAYFSNGSEGSGFESEFCDRCAHQETCTVWLLHLSYNYDQCNDGLKEIVPARTVTVKDGTDEEQPAIVAHGPTLRLLLSTLIPARPDGSYECTMFHATKEYRPSNVQTHTACPGCHDTLLPLAEVNAGRMCRECEGNIIFLGGALVEIALRRSA